MSPPETVLVTDPPRKWLSMRRSSSISKNTLRVRCWFCDLRDLLLVTDFLPNREPSIAMCLQRVVNCSKKTTNRLAFSQPARQGTRRRLGRNCSPAAVSRPWRGSVCPTPSSQLADSGEPRHCPPPLFASG